MQVNQETFLRQRIAKANEQVKKMRKENREKEMTRLMFQSLTGAKGLQGLTMVDLNDLGWLIDHNLKDITKQIESLAKPSPPQPPPPPQPHAAAWLMDLVSVSPHQDQGMGGLGLGLVGEDMLLPFGDHFSNHNNNAMWSNAFFP